jgi:hypothetical protein
MILDMPGTIGGAKIVFTSTTVVELVPINDNKENLNVKVDEA